VAVVGNPFQHLHTVAPDPSPEQAGDADMHPVGVEVEFRIHSCMPARNCGFATMLGVAPIRVPDFLTATKVLG